MKRNFGYRGHDPEIGEPANAVKGVIEIEEASIWRRSDAYPGALGVKTVAFKKTASETSATHNPIASGNVPFIQNEEYYIHVVENFSQSSSGTTTRYWSIDSTAHDLMFQDLTGSVAIDNQTGLGTAVFRTRFIDWFTTAPTFNLRIRSGSVTGTILKTFTIELMLPYVSTEFYDATGNLDASQGGLTEGQQQNSYNDWRLFIGNVGENASAGFSGLVKARIASTTFNSTASADDIEINPAAPFDQVATSSVDVAQTGTGETAANIYDFDGFNVRSDAATEGTESFSVGLEVYKDPLVGGTATVGNITLDILDTSTPFTISFNYEPAAGQSYGQGGSGMGPRFYYQSGSPTTGNLYNLFSTLGYIKEGVTTRFIPYTTSTGVGGSYYYEIVAATGNHTDYFGNVLGTFGGTNADWTNAGAGTGSYSGHFTLDDTGAFVSSTPILANGTNGTVNNNGIDVQAVSDNFGGAGPRADDVAEEYEGFKLKIYPENKTPATLLRTSVQCRIVDVAPNEIWARMVNFGSSSYWDTTGTNGGNLTNGFDIKDFTVPSILNGVTARIYIGVKVNGNTNNLHDFGIGGLQILDLTQSNSYDKVQRAMAIRGLNSEQTWVTKSNPLNYETSAGYFETTDMFNCIANNGEYIDFDIVKNKQYHSLNYASSTSMSTNNNFVNGRFNVTGFNNFGTPTTYTGFAGGVNPNTHNMTGGFVPLNAENSTTINVQPQTQASFQAGHIYFESDGYSGSLTKGCALRSPTYTFTTGETIRVAFGIATKNNHSFDATDAFFLGVG